MVWGGKPPREGNCFKRGGSGVSLRAEDQRPVFEVAGVQGFVVCDIELPRASRRCARKGSEACLRSKTLRERRSGIRSAQDRRGARGIEDRVDEVVARAAVVGCDFIGRARRIAQEDIHVRVPRVRDIKEQRGPRDRRRRKDIDRAGNASWISVRDGERRVGRAEHAKRLAHCTRREVRRQGAIRVGAIDVAVAVVVDVVVADGLGEDAYAGIARANSAWLDGAHVRTTVTGCGIVVIALFRISNVAVTAHVRCAHAGFARARVTLFNKANRRATVAVVGVAIVAGLVEFDIAVTTNRSDTRTEHERPIVERAVVGRVERIRDLERPQTRGRRELHRVERIFRRVTRAERSSSRQDRGDARGARRVQDRVLEIVAATAARRGAEVERRTRGEDAPVEVRVPRVRGIEPKRSLVDDVVCRKPVHVDGTFQEVWRVRDRVAAIGRVVHVEPGAAGACREVRRHVAIGIQIVRGAVTVVVHAVVAEVFAVLTIARRPCAGVARFDRAESGAAVQIVRVAVVAAFTHVDNAVATSQHADARLACALVASFDSAPHGATITIGGVTIVAAFAHVHAAVATAQSTHAGRARAFVTSFDTARRGTTVTRGGIAVVTRFAHVGSAIATAQAAHAGRARAFVPCFDAAGRRATVTRGGIAVVTSFARVGTAVAAAQATHAGRTGAFITCFNAAYCGTTITSGVVTVVAVLGARDARVAADVRDTRAHAANVARAVPIDRTDLAVGAIGTGAAAAVDVRFDVVFHAVRTGGRSTRIRGAHAARTVSTGQTFDAHTRAVALRTGAAVGTRRSRSRIGMVWRGRTRAGARIHGARIHVVADVVGLVDTLRAADAVALFFLTISASLVWRDRSHRNEVCLARTSVTGVHGTIRRGSTLCIRGASNTHAAVVAVQSSVRTASRILGLVRVDGSAGIARIVGAVIAVVGQVGVLRIRLRLSRSIADDKLAVSQSLSELCERSSFGDVHRATLASIAGAQDAFGAGIGAVHLGRTFGHRAARTR